MYTEDIKYQVQCINTVATCLFICDRKSKTTLLQCKCGSHTGGLNIQYASEGSPPVGSIQLTNVEQLQNAPLSARPRRLLGAGLLVLIPLARWVSRLLLHTFPPSQLLGKYTSLENTPPFSTTHPSHMRPAVSLRMFTCLCRSTPPSALLVHTSPDLPLLLLPFP